MKKSMMLSVAILLMLSLLAACGGKNNADNTPGPTTSVKDDPAAKNEPSPVEVSGEITIWAEGADTLELLLPGFNEKYPKVKVNIVATGWETSDKTLAAIIAGQGGPDIVQYEGGNIKRYNGIEGLEDLLSEPYNAGELKSKFSDSNWERWMSSDGKKLIAFPWDAPPGVTYYRSDIMDQFGFPSDPQDFGDFIADPDNFFSMAQTLKAAGKWVKRWPTDVMDVFTSNKGYFDRDLNFVRNTDEYVKMLDIAKKFNQLGLISNIDMWGDDGKAAMNSGKLVLIESGSWFGGCCMAGMTPDTAGKWRVTRLPLDIYTGTGGSTVSLLSQSKNKEAAWAFIKYAFASDEGQKEFMKAGFLVPGYKPAWDFPEFKDATDEFLGGQKANELYASLVDKIPHTYYTPLDDKAGEIWGQGINDAITKNLDSRAALQKIEEDIMKAVAADREKMLADR